MPVPGYRSLLTDQSDRSGLVQPLQPQIGHEIAYTCVGAWSEWMSTNACLCYHGATAPAAVLASNAASVSDVNVPANPSAEMEHVDQSAILEHTARILEALLRAGHRNGQEDWRRYLAELRCDLVAGAGQTLDFFPIEIETQSYASDASDWDALQADWATVHNDFSTVWQAIAHAHFIIAEEGASRDGCNTSQPEPYSSERDPEFVY